MTRTRRTLLLTLALLSSTLACRYATSLIFPATPTPFPSPTATSIPDTPIPTLPLPTPTEVYEASCPTLLEEIVDTATSDSYFEDSEEEEYYVVYEIADDSLDTRKDFHATNHINAEQDSRARHETLWAYFSSIIPPEERKFLTRFAVISDGRYNLLAAVTPNYDNPTQWTLELDILDSDNYHDLTFTLLHEFGHLLTLNSKQVPVNRRVLYNPDDIELHDQAVADCPGYFTGEGCSNTDSYINEFFIRFWPRFYEEWKEIDLIEDEDDHLDKLDEFYDAYKDQFLTNYATISPAEDIAESWSFFILSPKPGPDSIANEKITFFYEYPELVQLREDILNRICEAFPEDEK